MLPKERRLSGHEVASYLKSKGVLSHSPSFSLIKQIPSTPGPSRFAVVVSKKVSKLAVDRNWAKRRIMEGITAALSIIPENSDYLFLVKPAILTKTSEQIANEINEIFTKAL